jgi:hypothetical protein
MMKHGAMNPWDRTLPEGIAAVLPGSSPSFPRRYYTCKSEKFSLQDFPTPAGIIVTFPEPEF